MWKLKVTIFLNQRIEYWECRCLRPLTAAMFSVMNSLKLGNMWMTGVWTPIGTSIVLTSDETVGDNHHLDIRWEYTQYKWSCEGERSSDTNNTTTVLINQCSNYRSYKYNKKCKRCIRHLDEFIENIPASWVLAVWCTVLWKSWQAFSMYLFYQDCPLTISVNEAPVITSRSDCILRSFSNSVIPYGQPGG